MGAEYLPYVKSIATYAPTFFGYIISVLASVKYVNSFNNDYFLHIVKKSMILHSVSNKIGEKSVAHA